MSKLTISPQLQKQWLAHYKEWDDCQRCPLGCQATKHVLARGTLPCDLLFIGEAPDESEDAIGYPFVGPAGKVLDELIYCGLRGDAFTEFDPKDSGPGDVKVLHATYAITNIVACIPRPEDGEQGNFRQPTREEAQACSPRLQELVRLANPRGVVLLGKVASKFAKLEWTGNVIEIHHPSYISHSGGATARNGNFTRAVLQLRNFVKEVMT